jgi:hypothetical protein
MIMKSRDHSLIFIAEFVLIGSHTIVMIVHASENTGAARTAKRRRIESLCEGDALIKNQSLRLRHELHTVMTLVIGNDDNEIGAAAS